MENIRENDLEFLRNKYERLQKDLLELKQDLKYITPLPGRQTENFLNTRRTTQKVFILEEPKKRKVNNRIRLEIYKLVSGIHVDDISFVYYPIRNEDGIIIDTTWYKFYVKARINQTNFNLSYVSNQNIENCYEDKIQTCDIKELEIKMSKKLHQSELKDSLLYFNKNPSNIGLALLCVKDYEILYNIRLAIRKLLLEENTNFLKCKYLLNDDESLYLEMQITGENRDYFVVKWSIVWDENIMTVKDKFDIIIQFQDEQFLESINHNFEKLTANTLSKIVVLDINDEKISKDSDSYTLSETEKLTLLRNSILAAKACE